MKPATTQLRWFTPPPITRVRIAFALTVAVATDAAQFFFGPAGWVLPDQALDVVAMVLTWWALGFHPLLLPTFVIELIPLADMLPTWTGCTMAVIALRKRAAGSPKSAPTPNPDLSGPPVIDIPGPASNKPD
jgi:hypothetical protein